MTAFAFDHAYQKHVPTIALGTLLLFAFYLLGYALVLFLVFVDALALPLASLVCAALAYMGFTIAHDAGHGAIFAMNSRWKWVETVMGWVASIPLMLVPYRLFQKIHDRHHAFTNDPDLDPDHYTWGPQWYKLVLNSVSIPFQYHRLALTTYKTDPQIRATYVSTVIYFCCVLSAVVFLLSAGYVAEVFYLLILPVILAVIALAFFFDYIPHYPHKMLDRFHNTRIYPSRILNLLLLGQNYHLIHHLYPRVPWYRYRSVYLDIKDALEGQDAPIESPNSQPGLLRSPFANRLTLRDGSLHRLLRVSDIKKLTTRAVEISFELPDEQSFRYSPGQFVTVTKALNGQRYTRAYSLCRSSHEAKLTIGVQRQSHGKLSRYLNDELRVGDELIVQGPYGEFALPSESRVANKAVFFYAAGSGITPIKSMIEWRAHQGEGPSYLLYVCRNENDAMYLSDLQHLAQQPANQLYLTVHFTQGMVQKQPFKHEHLVQFFMKRGSPFHLDEADHILCGPSGFQRSVIDALSKQSVPSSAIRRESFVQEPVEPASERYKVTLQVNGKQHSIPVASNQTLLSAALANNLNVAHACGQGLCGSCKCRVETGRVKSKSPLVGLSEEEIAEGYTLACQSFPERDSTVKF